jgi:putative intracellular protease/amidase/YHS domain-containing protein
MNPIKYSPKLLVFLFAGLCCASLSFSVGANPSPAKEGGSLKPIQELPKLTLPTEGHLPVAIVVGKGAEVLDFCGPLEVFANAMTSGGKAAFDPFLVAASEKPVQVSGGMTVVPKYSFKNAPAPKIIVIPAMSPEAATAEMLDWIRMASQSTDVTMSVCNGVYTLAKTGLLDGRRATAHHNGYFRLAATFPKIQLIRISRYVEDGKFACAGGVSSGIDLALRIVERYRGREAAQEVADYIEYQGKGWLDPHSASPYSTLVVSGENHPLCPLCGMEGDKSISYLYKGKAYYFCSENEKKLFTEHPKLVDQFQEETIQPTTDDNPPSTSE